MLPTLTRGTRLTRCRAMCARVQLGSLKLAGNPLQKPSLEIVATGDAEAARKWCWEEYARRETTRIRGRNKELRAIVLHGLWLTRFARWLQTGWAVCRRSLSLRNKKGGVPRAC